MSTELQVLIRAREMVMSGWVKGSAYADGHNRRCAGQAITDSYLEITGRTAIGPPCMCGSCHHDKGDAFNLAVEAFTVIIDNPSIPSWNDAACRTHAEVIRAFDRAIARLQNREAPVMAVVPEKIEATWKPIEKIVIPPMVIEAPSDEPVGLVKKVLASIGV